MDKPKFTPDEAKRIGDSIGIDWDKVDLEQFRRGLEVESEHGAHDLETNVTNNDPQMTGKIAWAHLKEIPDYYTRLDKMESEAEAN
jgi:hypothetical protein